MENYVKVVLYAYPVLKSVERDYAEHIKNKALLSYNNPMTAENLAVYLAEEIICKNKLLWLKRAVEQVVGRLSEEEQDLLAARFFGKKKKSAKRLGVGVGKGKNSPDYAAYARRYFRKLNKVSEKVGAMLQCAGLTKEVFLKDFAHLDILKNVQRILDKRVKDKAKRKEEKRLHNL